MRSAKELLEKLTIALPPKSGRHSLYLHDDGRLAVAIRIPNDLIQSFYLDDFDLETPVASLVQTICQLLGVHHGS